MSVPFYSNIDLSKNQLLNALFQILPSAPSSPKEAQFYYNSTEKKLYFYNGTDWIDSSFILPIATASILGGVKIGSNINVNADGVISVTINNTLTSTATNAALSAAQGKALKDIIDAFGDVVSKNVGTAVGNVPVIGSDGKLNPSIIPAIALTEVFTVASQAEMLALNAQMGDVAIRTDENKIYLLSKTPAATLANWVAIEIPVTVTSVNGKTGAVVLDGSNINVTMKNTTSGSSTLTLNKALDSLVDLLNGLQTSLTEQITEVSTNLEATNKNVSTNTTNISALQKDNTQNKTDISNLKTDNTQNKTDISNLKTDNTQNKEDIASLDTRVSNLEKSGTAGDRWLTKAIGDGSAKSFTITHNFGTKNVMVEIYETSTGQTVYADVTRTTTAAVKIDFSVAPTSNQFTVIVHAAKA